MRRRVEGDDEGARRQPTGVISRMTEEAEAKGADAVVAMRSTPRGMGDTWTEICAYGTAVRIART
jgi:uncharacterized protein YbjQ (UPF0145 family)